MKTDTSTRVIQNGLLFAIALTPFFSLREFLKFSGVTTIPSYAIFLNLTKDLLLAFLFVFCLVHLIRRKTYPVRVLPFFLFFFAYTALVAALSLPDVLMVAGGLRWAMPLLFVFLLCPYMNSHYLHRLAKVCIFLLIIMSVVQLYQVVTKQFRWHTTIYTDWLGRVPGFFELPSTAGILACLFFFIIRYYYTGPQRFRRFMLVLAMLSNFLLSISTTGFLLMGTMLFFPLLYRPGRFRSLYVAIAFILTVVTYFFIDLLNGRAAGDSSVSWNIRVALMQTEWQHSQLVSTRFGSATNAVTILKTALHQPIDPSLSGTGGGESFYPPLLGNYGSLFFLLFIGLLLYLFIHVIRYRTEAKSLFFFITILGALTVRITEIFPVGMLIAILTAYYIGKHPKEQHGQTIIS